MPHPSDINQADPVDAMPSAPWAEKSILSAMMQKPDLMIGRGAAEGLTIESFWVYGKFYQELVGYHSKFGSTGGEIELLTFVEFLKLEGRLDSLGGPATVADVYGAAVTSDGWGNWVMLVRNTQASRRLLKITQDIAEADGPEDAAGKLEIALQEIRKTLSGGHRSTEIRAAASAFSEHLDELFRTGDIPGGSTGIAELDAASGGMRPGEFWVIGGQTSRGKSVLMLQIAAEFISRKEPVVIFSLELPVPEVVGRLASVMGRIDYGSLTQPRTASKLDIGKISTTLKQLCRLTTLWIDGSASQTIDTIRDEAVRLRDLNGGKMGLVVVDYLQICGVDRVKNEMREREVARVSGGLKQLAKELKCPVISASQLNDDGRVRESRAIAQDADALIMILEDGLKVMKLRNGQRDGILPLVLNGRFQRFSYSSKP